MGAPKGTCLVRREGMVANRTIMTKRLIHRKRAHRRRLSFLHTENLQFVKAARQAKRLNERSGGHGAVFMGEPPLGHFPTGSEDHAPSNGGSCSASCRNPQDSQVELVPDSQDIGSGAAPEGESADTSDWCSEWSRKAHRTGGMRRGRATRSTTCARRASRTRGTNRRLGNRRAVLRTPVIVTVRVTASRGAERGYRRSTATTRAKPDGRGRCREMASIARLGVGPIGVEARGERRGRWARRRWEAASRAMR